MKNGDDVSWKWGKGTANGKIIDINEKRIQKNLKGNTVTRNGSEDNPALLIEQDNGNKVLKLESEIDK